MMQKAYLFGSTVLYSGQPIPQEDVPKVWFCYDLRGTDRAPDRPYSLVDQAEKNHAGSVLSLLPLKSERARIILCENCSLACLRNTSRRQTNMPGKTPASSAKIVPPAAANANFFLPKLDVHIGRTSVRHVEMHKGGFGGKDAFSVVTEIWYLEQHFHLKALTEQGFCSYN